MKSNTKNPTTDSKKNEINIAFSTDDRGVEMMLVSIFSIMKQHSPAKYTINVYVIESGLEKKNKAKISKLSEEFSNLSVKYLMVDASLFKKFSLPQVRISHQAYYRYLLPNLLPKREKVLYMDIDIICRGELYDLYNADISEHYIAAVPSHSIENDIGKYDGYKKGIGMSEDDTYFNSGVLLMNLEKIRQDSKVDEFLYNAYDNRSNIIGEKYDVFVDQTVANITFGKKSKTLPYKWNSVVHSHPYMKDEPVLLHFAGVHKPFIYTDTSPKVHGYMDEYLALYVKTMALVGNEKSSDDDSQMLKKQLRFLYQQISDYQQQIASVERKHSEELNSLYNSRSWKLSAPLRSVKRVFKKTQG